jgi:hypothetical protein
MAGELVVLTASTDVEIVWGRYIQVVLLAIGVKVQRWRKQASPDGERQ